ADAAINPGGEEATFRASFEQPEKGPNFDQWLLDLGRVMAGLEKYRTKKGGSGRNLVEVAA
ncbi:MAG: hypothetical protein ACK5QQ_15150, partial [Cyanobacteriota bacterium]